MSLIASTADRLLGALVPRAKAAAWSCPPGCHRKTCGCFPGNHGGFYWFDSCVSTVGGHSCKGCTQTAWQC